MAIIVAHSQKTDAKSVAADLRNQLGSKDLSLVLLFATSHLDPEALAAAVQTAMGSVPTVGCTTAGEIVGGRMFTDSVVAAGVEKSTLTRVCIEVVAAGDTIATHVQHALGRLESCVGNRLNALDQSRHVGMVLHDGMCGAEEQVMEAISDRTNLPFIGGSAGDDVAFRATHLFANGKVHHQASVLVCLSLANPYDIVKTQSFRPTSHSLVVTRADESRRTVHEFNHKPAAEEYARVLSTDVATLPNHFMKSPLGLMTGEVEAFVRSPQRVEGTSVVFYCAMRQGMELRLLEATDLVKQTGEALKSALARKPVTGILMFDCILRRLQLEAEKRGGEYAQLFAGVPTVGFSTYGESYVGHINQTATMLVFH